MSRSTSLGRRLFPERQFLIRSGDSVRYLSLPGWSQAVALAALLGLVGGIGGLAGAYHHLHKAIHFRDAEISEAESRAAAVADLRQQLATADAQYAAMSTQFDDVRQQLDAATANNETLRVAIDEAEARAVALDKTRLALEERLHASEQSLAGKTGNLAQLSKALEDSRSELREAEIARVNLQEKLHQLQADSETNGSRTGQLKLALATREHDMQALAVERDRLRAQIEQQSAVAKPVVGRGYVSDLEHLIASTGLDIEKLVGPLSLPTDQGGPYVAFDPRRAAQNDVARTAELQKLLKTLPLEAPLTHYTLESGFGERIDPFRERPAFHTGLDLAAPYKSPVLATAPGVVSFTGVKGEYGRVVDISHGHGIVTRYAHLHRILVALGQTVQTGQTVGELGSSGRSTGPHVHYEVIVDGQQVDPAKFLRAGKNVAQISDTRSGDDK